jgi:2-polyprenyl-3-methyl-5-hydroxy-6-metoxy-1,4-benzoquinol methylase
MNETNIDGDPLRDSAPLAYCLALRLCGDAPNGGTCGWNHGLWQYLRLFGLITTPEHHARFYAEVFAAAAAADDGPVRVLISGAADYGMLAQVLAAFSAAGRMPAVTVLDACETPLELCRWYAARHGCTIQTSRSNILDYVTTDRFDIVCTHSFLGQFDDQDRKRLVAKWFELLKPGGRAATVNRVRPGRGGARVGFTSEQAQLFVAEVAGHVERVALPADVRAPVLLDMAREYSEKFGAWPVDSEVDIQTLFEGAGFRVDVLACEAVGASGAGAVSGPSTPGGASYACILTRRPG